MARKKKQETPLPSVTFAPDGQVVDEDSTQPKDPPQVLATELHPAVSELGEPYRAMSTWDPRRPEKESLPVRLNPDEIRELGIRNAEDYERLEVMKEDHASIKKGLKASEDNLQRQISERSRVVRKGVKLRDVEVVRVADLDRCVARLLRVDTGEFVDGRDRPLATHEVEELRQQKLPGV